LGGTAVGGLFGMPSSGGSVGHSLGASLSKWLGSGDYQITKNTIVDQNMSSTIPVMHKGDQSIVVRHREFITTVLSSETFQVRSSFDINPGNVYLFPWLAGIASRFQEYKVRGMVFHYVPTSGSAVASTNAALGSVMLQTSYRASDKPPASKIEMLNEYNSNEAVPCDAFCHPIECDPKENPFNIQYVRSMDLPANEDKLLYDLGTTHVAVSGCQTTGKPIGDLWVTYEVELKKPIVASNVTSPYKTYGLRVLNAPNGASLFTGTQNSYGSLAVTATANTITFAKGVVGSFQVIVTLGGPFSAYTWAGDPTLVNCSGIIGPSGGESVSPYKNGTTDTAQQVTYTAYFQVLDPSLQATVTVPTPSVLTGTITRTLVTVTPYVLNV
jgi:hypothetical protein